VPLWGLLWADLLEMGLGQTLEPGKDSSKEISKVSLTEILKVLWWGPLWADWWEMALGQTLG